MSDHHELSPSKFPAWLKCACFDNKGEVGEAAERGTFMHRVMKHLLDTGTMSDEAKGLNDEEWTGVQWAAHYIKTVGAGTKIETEVKMHFFENEDDIDPLFFGTLDAANGIDLFDLKTGEKRDYSPQMMAYAAMLCQKNGVDSVTVHELYSKYKEENVYSVSLYQAQNMISRVLEKRLDPQRVATPCEYCKWCEHAATCSALNTRALAVATGREDWKLSTYHSSEITKPEEMAKALDLANMLEGWVESVKYHAGEMAIKRGECIPGYAIKRKQGNRKVEDVKKAQELSGLSPEEFFALCDIGVTKLEKELGKKEFAARLDPIVKRGEPSVYLSKEKGA